MSPNPTGIYSGENIIIQAANDAMIRLWGKDRNIIGLPMGEAIPELHGQPFLSILKEVITTGRSYEGKDVSAQLKINGQLDTYYFDFIYRAVLNPVDGTYCILHTATDVTERHHSNLMVDSLNRDLLSVNEELTFANTQLLQARLEAEKQKERLYQFLMEIPAGICVLTGPGLVYEMVNTAYQKLLPERNFIGKSIFEALPEIIGQPVEEKLRYVYRTGKALTDHELLIPLAEQEGEPVLERYFTITYLARRNSAESIDGILISVYEVSEQVNARKRLEESEKHFRHLADLVPAKISNALPSGEVSFFNRQWLDYSGLSFEALRDFGYYQMLHPDEIEDFQSGLAAAAATGIPFESEMRFKNKEGNYRWHLNIASPILDKDGHIEMWVGSTTDIQKIKEEERRKVDFISMLSHELRTPITSIRGYAQLLLSLVENNRDIAFPAALKTSLKRIDIMVMKLNTMINDMLHLTRIESAQLELKPTPVNLNELVESVITDLRITNGSRHIHLSQSFHCTVLMDKDKIEQVIINLISNALKYSPGSPGIDVRVFQEKDGLAAVSVRDYGIGIDSNEHQKIFDRFYRVDGMAEQHFSGFGIGLFIAHTIIKRHNGSIKVESEKGKGSVFTFCLPVVRMV